MYCSGLSELQPLFHQDHRCYLEWKHTTPPVMAVAAPGLVKETQTLGFGPLATKPQEFFKWPQT